MSIDSDIPLILSLVFIIGGLFALAKSADVFVASAAAIARKLGISPLIVGMVIIGFGTSAPELLVSVISSMSGHSNLSLGNAYGSGIFNIGVILGVTALIWPMKVKPSVNCLAVPLLSLITLLSWYLASDGTFSRGGGLLLLLLFAVIMPFYCWYDQRKAGGKSPEAESAAEVASAAAFSPVLETVKLIAGLAVLVLSSHVLIWGCVDFARDVLHVSDLLIGLTVVAAGTSLPELASAIASARKGENEFVIGNVIGSNLFNTLMVVGLAGAISPFTGYSKYILTRDLPVMLAMTLAIAAFGINFRKPRECGTINRIEGAVWVLGFIAYLAVMIVQET